MCTYDLIYKRSTSDDSCRAPSDSFFFTKPARIRAIAESIAGVRTILAALVGYDKVLHSTVIRDSFVTSNVPER